MKIYKISNGVVSEWVLAYSSEDAYEWWANHQRTEHGIYPAEECPGMKVVREYQPHESFSIHFECLGRNITHTVQEWVELFEFFDTGSAARFMCSSER